MDVISWTEHPKPTSALKSNKNSYLISLFLPNDGERDPEYNAHMKIELAEAVAFVNTLINQPRLYVAGHGFHNITVILCVDMKCLCAILGMNAITMMLRSYLQGERIGLVGVWHSNSTFGCCWCEVKRCRMHDFEFRNIQSMKDTWDVIKKDPLSKRKSSAKNHVGQVNEPLFYVPLTQIIPCNLHLTMSIVKMLRKKRED